MQESLLKDLASPGGWKKYLLYNEEREITEKSLTRFCPQPNCDGTARLSDYPQAGDAGRYLSVQCKACSHEFCANCASEAHHNKGCKQVGDKVYFKGEKAIRQALSWLWLPRGEDFSLFVDGLLLLPPTMVFQLWVAHSFTWMSSMLRVPPRDLGR